MGDRTKFPPMWFEWQMEGPAKRCGKPIAPGFLRSALEVVLSAAAAIPRGFGQYDVNEPCFCT
jgi:hypothetical protein